jgi:hypothetical protein
MESLSKALDNGRTIQDYFIMKAKTTTRMPARLWRYGIGGVLLVTGTMIDHRSAAALPDVNTVIANPTPQAPIETEDQQNQPNEMDVFQPAVQPAGATLPEVFQYGPLKLRPHVDYQVTYGNGIQYTPGAQAALVIQDLSPGLTMDLGPHWVLDYTPMFQFYSSKQFQDTVNHAITLTGGVSYEAWQFGLSHNTQITSQPLVETGMQTDQTAHTTTLSASHPLNDNWSTDFALNQTITLVSGFDDSYDWNTMDWLNYKFSPRLSAGVGVGVGYVLVEANGQGALGQINGNNGNLDQTYEDLKAQVKWRATQKVSFQINGGLEDRQFSTPGTSDSLDPIFGASIEYQPFETTQITLSANRTVASSDYYLAAQEMQTTLVTLSVNQGLVRSFNLQAGVTYSRMDYGTPTGGATTGIADRSDDVVSFNTRLSHPFYKRGTWAIFYQYSQDTSSQQGFGFESNQVGFDISYSY